MNLSKDLISQFVKATNDEEKPKKESTMYGTIKIYNDSEYVQLDGSDLLTPISSTTKVDDGERVTVMIKNHTATVTGNITSPSAKNSDLEDTVDQIAEFEIVVTDELYAHSGRIDNLVTENLTVKERLTANEAVIETLEANNVTINGKLEAVDAFIENADITYANIDFANIGMAAVEKLFAESGIIKDLVISDSHVTGELVGVTIKGDIIEGNTIVANKLVVLGEDGLYYKLNTSGNTVEAEQTQYNSLNGSVIMAKSVTATKIYVDDLVAFDATIGGFNISSSSLYSGTKSSISNTTRGIYLDKDGQIAFGDSSNFVKFYKNSSGNYILKVSAESFNFGSSSTNVIASSDGITIKNGGIKILNNNSDTVLSGDSSGNLTMNGAINIRSNNSEYIIVSTEDSKSPMFCSSITGTYTRGLVVTNDYTAWSNEQAITGSYIQLSQDGSNSYVWVRGSSNTSYLSDSELSTGTVRAKNIWMRGNDVERQIGWEDASKNSCKCYFYCGDSSSSTIVGLYNSTNGLGVWSYDTDSYFRIHRRLITANGITVTSTPDAQGALLRSDDTTEWKCIKFQRYGCKALYGIGSNGSGTSQNYPAIECWDSGGSAYSARLEIKSDVLKYNDESDHFFKCWVDSDSHGGIAIGSTSTTYLKWLRGAAQLQVRNYDDNAYTQIVASAFTNGSKREFKENISDISETKIRDIIMDNDIKTYNLISEREEIEELEKEADDKGIILDDEMLKINTKAGLIIEDLTEDAEELLHPERTEGIDIYVMASILWKHNQYQQKRMEILEAKVEALEYLLNN